VLGGSHRDPSIVRAGDDFFVATSTFEWYPAVQIHRSRDLAHTGAFVGLWVWDLTGHGHPADFDAATFTTTP
jgi:beta-xylosidase